MCVRSSTAFPTHPAQRRYPPELRDRATRMVLDIFATGERQGVIGRVARQLDVSTETLRGWVKQAEIDSAGTTKQRSWAGPSPARLICPGQLFQPCSRWRQRRP